MANLKDILKKIETRQLSLKKAEKEVANFFFSDQGSVKVDNHRQKRCGFAEVIYCPGKSAAQIRKMAEEIIASGSNLLATKASVEDYKTIKDVDKRVEFNSTASLVFLEQKKMAKVGSVVIASAGSADTPVAEEAALTAQINGSKIQRIYDAGVAGIHRLLYFREDLAKAKVVVAVAGMEGALPSVAGGLVSCPVIAVPTSVGYGASFQGLSALLTMLNSCTPNVSVVNIDNGFGAGYVASIINNQSSAGLSPDQLNGDCPQSKL